MRPPFLNKGLVVLACSVFTELMTQEKARSACPGEQSVNRGNDIGISYTWTGQGGYVMIAAEGMNPLNLGGIPAGATIVKAYVWGVHRYDGTSCDLNLDFNGTPVSGIVVGSESMVGHGDWCSARYDVTSLITGNGSYTIGNWLGVNTGLMVIYQDLSDIRLTTVQVQDGLMIWHFKSGVPLYGRIDWPLWKEADWTCANNPVCDPPDVQFSRLGGPRGTPLIVNEEIWDPGTMNQRCVIGTDVYDAPFCCIDYDLDSYDISACANPGETQSRWAFTYLDANKNTEWVNALVWMTRCPMAQTPTPSFGTPTQTPSPTCQPSAVLNAGAFGGTAWVNTAMGLPAQALGLQSSGGLASAYDHFNSGWYEVDDSFVSAPAAVTVCVVWKSVTRPPGGHQLRFDYNVDGSLDGLIDPDLVLTNLATNVYQTDCFALTPPGGWDDTKLDQMRFVLGNSNGKSGGERIDIDWVYFQVQGACSAVSTPTPTRTWTRTPTPTMTFSPTFTRTFSPTVTFTATWTSTWTNTFTYTNSPTRSFTATPTPTWTVTFTYTSSPTRTFTATPTPTYTQTFTYTASPTRSSTPTPTPTWTVTHTYTFSPSRSFTATPTPTYTQTHTYTHSPSRTHTRTSTPTSSPTATPTASVSPTPTPSSTPSWTHTHTHTPLPTLTPTRTVTSTFTSTWTYTITHTFTLSPSNTSTSTMTSTYSVSDSPTPSASPTETPSWTRTWTDTSTHTMPPSRTGTRTFTATFTETETPTPSDTSTDTPTWTQTPTVSDSPTYSASPSPTATETLTDTETDTPIATPTWTPTFTASDSPTSSASPTPTITDSHTATQTSTSSHSPSHSPTPTASASPTYSATNTPTSTPSSTPTSSPTWTLSVTESSTRTSSPTRTATPTQTPSRTQTSYSSPTPTFTVTSTRTGSPTPAPSATSTSTPQEIVVVRVGVYNEAGELVGVISEGEIFDGDVNEFFFLDGASSLTDDQDTLALVFPAEGNRDPVTLVWAGTGLDGEPLANGAYVIKVESVDSLGLTTVITGSATILRSGRSVTVQVFNEAGELIWTETRSGVLADQADVSIQGDTLNPRLGPASPGGSVEIVLGASGSIVWDGTNLEGLDVANGEYLIVVEVLIGANSAVISDTVSVLGGSSGTAQALLAPNPAPPGTPVEIRLSSTALGSQIKVYTVSAELVRSLEASGDRALWDQKDRSGSQVAAGLYILLVQTRESDGSLSRNLVRLVILR